MTDTKTATVNAGAVELLQVVQDRVDYLESLPFSDLEALEMLDGWRQKTKTSMDWLRWRSTGFVNYPGLASDMAKSTKATRVEKLEESGMVATLRDSAGTRAYVKLTPRGREFMTNKTV